MKNILFVFASLVPLCARADLPLSLEDAMTDKGKLKLDASITTSTAKAAAPNSPPLCIPKREPPPLSPFRLKFRKTAATAICLSARSAALRANRKYRYLRQRQLLMARKPPVQRRKQQNPRQTPLRCFSRHQPHLPQRRQKPRPNRLS